MAQAQAQADGVLWQAGAKEKLDKFLSNIPDETNVEGLTPATCDLYSAAPSNSIIDQNRGIKIRVSGV